MPSEEGVEGLNQQGAVFILLEKKGAGSWLSETGGGEKSSGA